jgi:hypothetical protein
MRWPACGTRSDGGAGVELGFSRARHAVGKSVLCLGCMRWTACGRRSDVGTIVIFSLGAKALLSSTARLQAATGSC